jgi:hypothetical protein
VSRVLVNRLDRDDVLEHWAAELAIAAYSCRPPDQDGGDVARSGIGPLEGAGQHAEGVGTELS